LLELGRDEVRDALRRARIGWREDSSNADPAFARNRVRLELLPAFRSLHPAAEANLLRTAALLAEDDAALDTLAAELLCEGGLSTAAVAAAPPAVLRRALGAWRLSGAAPTARRWARSPAPARARGTVPFRRGSVAEHRYGTIVLVRRAAGAAPTRSRWRCPAGRSTATRSCFARLRPTGASTPSSRHCSLCARRVR
jgi:tRNA(Ile)-lysidine synthase